MSPLIILTLWLGAALGQPNDPSCVFNPIFQLDDCAAVDWEFCGTSALCCFHQNIPADFPQGELLCTCPGDLGFNNIACTAEVSCATDNTCDPDHGVCDDSTGAIVCSCDTGFTIDLTDPNACNDIDECQGVTPCGLDTRCENLPGNYQCVACPCGFTTDPMDPTQCTDVNECADPNQCDTNANCQNSEGSFTCTCNDGYEGDGSACTDEDECATGQNNCDANANCENTIGSFTCTCTEDFVGDGITCDLAVCPDGWEEACGKCYMYVDTALPWEDAQNLCANPEEIGAQGATLVSIHNAAEQCFVKRLASCRRAMWIGLSDAATEDTYVWTDGSALDYTDWANHEPNNRLGWQRNADCVRLAKGRSFQWTDAPCANCNNFVCQLAVPGSDKPCTYEDCDTPEQQEGACEEFQQPGWHGSGGWGWGSGFRG